MDSYASVGKSNPGRSTRRVWTPAEEKALANALKDLVVRGWKCENGFRSGYTHVLEQSLVQVFPGTDIRAEPHISSRIHVWKKHYGSLMQMLSRSGFSWNETSNTVEVKVDAHWNQYVKEDASAKNMRHKSWPLYSDWCEIFGKDQATGEYAQSFTDVVNDLPANSVQMDDQELDVPDASDRASPMTEGGASSRRPCESSSSARKVKRKTTGDQETLQERMYSLLESLCEKTDTRLGDIAARIGY